MHRITVLVIEEGAEAGLMLAALARRPEVNVLDAPRLDEALERVARQREPVALAIAGAGALNKSAEELVSSLGARGIPVVGVVADLEAAARARALAAGVREIHERPSEWPRYAELIDSLVGRFTPSEAGKA